MIMTKDGDKFARSQVRARIRFDFRGLARPGRFFFGVREPEEMAAEVRAREVAALRNLPVQGIEIEEIDAEGEIYRLTDPLSGDEVAYAPVTLVARADSLEDLVRFMLREEFRKIDILEPKEMFLSHYDAEKMLYQVGAEMKTMLLLSSRREGGHAG